MSKSITNSTQISIDSNYEKIEDRLCAFIADHGESGQILTEIIQNDKDSGKIIFKAHAVVDGVIRATGHGMEEGVDRALGGKSYVESAENTAIGRCLAMMGYTPNQLWKLP